jgi:protein-disulfide isomerase
MKKLPLLSAALVVSLLFVAGVWAQKPRPKARPAAKPAAKTPAPTATPAPAPNALANTPPAQSGPVLATVNGQSITASDLGTEVAQELANEKDSLASVRRDALNRLANTYMLEAEASRRKITLEDLLDAEINKKIVEPTEAEAQAFYTANREQMNGQEFPAVREQIVNFLKQQQGQKLEQELVKRLLASIPVTAGADVNAPKLAPDAVLATVGGRPIVARVFENKVAPLVYRRRLALWNATMDVLELKVNDILLVNEARKRNLTPQQLLTKEVSEKVKAPTEAEITKFYNDNKAQIPAPLEQVRGRISELLMQQQGQKLEQELVARLRVGVNIQLLYNTPEPPVLPVSVDDDPARGPANAPVTIVAFTDFQCPTCAITHPVLEAVTSEFGDRVRLVVRDFPLSRHKDARKAAEAANAANAQGKFFDYIAILYKNQAKQDVPSLKGYAAALGLDRAKFDAELDSGKYAAEVEKDVQDGDFYGVAGTPTIFINGVRLEVLSSEAMRAAIQDALKKAGK